VRKDGSSTVLDWTSAPVVEYGLMYGAACDVTERRLAEAEVARLADEFTELVATAISNAESREALAALAQEQAALRRVATLVASEASQTDVFTAIAEEIARLFGADNFRIFRYDDHGGAVVVASFGVGAELFAVGSRHSLGGTNPTSRVFETRRTVRMDDLRAASGPIGESPRSIGIRSVVATPVMVEGRLWGAMAAGMTRDEPLPPEAESRLAQFTELMATAIANTESHARAEWLAAEQAALRRVATLVASGGTPDEIFAAVGDEVRQLVGNDLTSMFRCDPGDTLTLVAVRARSEPVPEGLVGARIPMRARFGEWLKTGGPLRLGAAATARWTADLPAAEQLGLKSAIGAPIVVGGRPWGAIFVCDTKVDGLSPEAERPFSQFTELVATAIANAQARSELSELATEQAALRRVATLVAREASQAEVFGAVAEEIRRLLAVDEIRLLRYERDEIAVVLAASGEREDVFPIGLRVPLGGDNAATRVFRTGRPARVEDYARASGPIAEAVGPSGLRSIVAAPVVVEGRRWGAMAVGTIKGEPLPPETESRLGQFTELMATAIANAEARAEVERLAEEQAALRRVATLVAQGARATVVFDAVTAEMERVLRADAVTLSRFESGAEVTVLAHRGSDPHAVPPGTRVSHRGENVTSLVRRTERSTRIEHRDGARGAIAETVRGVAVRASVGAPIVVDGRLWGLAIATWTGEESPPADTEERMAKFGELLDTAIANADSRGQLNASRARLVTEADEARRRVVRDLHDGAQQRLVHTIVTLKLAQQALRTGDDRAMSLVGEALEQAQQGNTELRELAHGILPAVLTRGGLRAGVEAVRSRLDLPVHVDVPRERFPAEIEASAYFIVAEALTNVVKHAHAERAEVTASVEDGTLRVEIRDNGIGGADPGGHGLLGIGDRVAALGGELDVHSPTGGGTLLAATLPLPAS
jgi:GAF domain-containing protein